MKLKKLICISLVLMMLLSTERIYAEETEALAEKPSTWAIWDVQLANAYGLVEKGDYLRYSTAVTGGQFLSVELSLEEKFNVKDTTKVTSDIAMNRGDVIQELYDVIELSLDLEASTNLTVLDYFVQNGLIKGRSVGNYGLDQVCTAEEMLVFSKRVYDHIIYALDMDSKGAFWKVSDDDNTLYLLGSIHLTDGSVYPMSQEILRAYTASDALVVEANIFEISDTDLAYMQQKMMIEGTVTIDQLISKKTYDAYVEAIQPLGLPAEIYNKFKPWYAALLIQNVQLMNSNYRDMLGIDMYFLSLADQVKPIIELEGLKFQVDMFDSFTAKLQEVYMTSTLSGESDKKSDVESTLDEFIEDWKIGDVKSMEAFVLSEEGATAEEIEYNEKLFLIRNENMTLKIEKLLSEDSEKDYFVVVGAGHLLSDKGIVQGLIDQGYKVEQVK